MYHSFMVRIWRDDGQDPGSFQITAELVQSGQTRRFDNLSSLLDFLHAYIDSDNLTEVDKKREELDKANSDASD